MLRNSEDLAKHKNNTVKNCERYFLSILSSSDTKARLHCCTNTCKSYLCDKCRRASYFKFRHRIKKELQKVSYTMWTFTVGTQFFDNPEKISELPKMFSTFWKRVLRKYPHAKYFRVLEIGKGGNPHFHCLINCFLPYHWLTENWEECSTGKVTHFRKINSENAAYYVTKYISDAEKSNANNEETLFLSHIRRFAYSRGILNPNIKEFRLHHYSSSVNPLETISKFEKDKRIILGIPGIELFIHYARDGDFTISDEYYVKKIKSFCFA